jgi:plastocyanin
MPPTQPTLPTQNYPDPNVVISSDDRRPSGSSSNKKLPVIALVLLFLVIGGVGAYTLMSGNNKSSTSTATASLALLASAQVSITNTGFVPATVTIKAGQAVTWTNNDTKPHVVASDPYPTDNALANFDSRQNLTTDDHYSSVFDKAGTYTYHDDLNPYALKGTVVVKQ